MGVNPIDNTTIAQLPENYRYMSAGLGIYSFVRFTKDTSRNPVKLLQYVKVELTLFEGKEGAFDFGSGTPTRLSSLYRELAVTLPATYKVSSSVMGYAAVGLAVCNRFSVVATPNQAPADVLSRTFMPAVVAEVGFMVAEGSCLGIRAQKEFSTDYPYSQTELFFGFCPVTEKKKKRE
jgi:hypothetical protein